jgi:hypothetical protein
MGHTPVRRWIENGTSGVAFEDLPAYDARKLLVDNEKTAPYLALLSARFSVQFYTSSRPAKK